MNKHKQTKMLHELIQLAKEGKKFRARLSGHAALFKNQEIFESDNKLWDIKQITTPWEYEEIREPEVVEFSLDCTEKNLNQEVEKIDFPQWQKLDGKKWKLVCTEVIE